MSTLKDMNRDQLRRIARSLKIPGYGHVSKSDLLQVIQKYMDSSNVDVNMQLS